MGSGHQGRWSHKWCSLFASMALLGLAGVGGAENSEFEDRSTSRHNNCENNIHKAAKRNLLLVSTMDGKISALNLEKEGNMEWTVDAGAIPLLSSSISDLEMMRNNVPTRLIPSLDGSLFQFDYKNKIIEALPFTADTLLSSSFKLNYDSTIVGGKESATYGVEASTGKIRYICNSHGCTKFEAETTMDTEDVLVLTRHTKTLRAVEMRSGIEKWNFSVGQHEVALLSSESNHMPHLTAASNPAQRYHQPAPSLVEGDEDSTVQSCPTDDEDASDEDDWFEYIRTSMFAEEEFAVHDLDLKIIVPKGLIIAFSKAEPDRVVWKYKFDTAIANAWILEGRNLSEVSLFNENVVPALMDEEMADMHPRFAPEALVYIGVHEKQFYVQPSVRLRDEVRDTMEIAAASSGAVPAMPRIRWHPYIATAPSRTPVVTGYSQPQIGYDNEETEEAQRDMQTGLALWQDQYPFDTGWYLMSDTSPIHIGHLAGNTDNRTSVYADVTLTMWNWKEVIMISLMTSIIFHLVIVRCFPRRICTTELSTPGCSVSSSEKSTEEVLNPALPAAVSSMSEVQNNNVLAEYIQPEYISRFETEFEPKQCLGRGGFGVVFEVRNQMDDCAYAVKRITVKNSKRAREKVMREVKALAKLEHTGIVRYYQAWFENPPAGWQEKRDTIILDMPSGTPNTPLYSTDVPGTNLNHAVGQGNVPSTATVLRSKAKLEHSVNREGKKQTESPLGTCDANNPLKMFGGLDRWDNTASSISGFSETDEKKKAVKKGGSGGFIPKLHSNGNILEESGSYSFGLPNQRNLIDESLSIDIEFRNSQEGGTYNSSNNVSNSGGSGKPVPFSQYNQQPSVKGLREENTNDSFNIVFEDSGCGSKGVNEEDDETGQNKGRDTRCTDLDPEVPPATAVVSHPQTPRPDSLLLVPGAVVPQDTDSVVDPRAPKLYLYIQMQLCHQDSLKDWLNCNTLSRDRRELLDIFDQIVSAVDYIHDIHGLMHRDLKPSNIFFSLDGTVKVGDFGLVTTLEEEHHTPAAVTSQHVAQHTGHVGTRLYMSPEQVAGSSYNHKVDIYSLGLIFFELFYPFATQMERINTLLEARKGNLPPRFVRELPDESVFVRSLLDANPDRRPTTKEIQQNPLLRDFEAARQTISRVRPRTRTTSSSGSGNSLSSSH